jgi:peroxiredoxin
MNTRALVISLLVLLVISAAVHYRSMPPRLADVPDISLLSVEGEELRLPAYRGRPLLVTFWSPTCPPCVKEIPHLIELYRELAPRGLEIIGITMAHDPPDQVLAMRKSRGIPYPVTLDIHAAAAHAFGDVRETPTSFLIGPDGRVARHKVGKLDMAGLRREILAMIAERQGSKPVIPAP